MGQRSELGNPPSRHVDQHVPSRACAAVPTGECWSTCRVQVLLAAGGQNLNKTLNKSSLLGYAPYTSARRTADRFHHNKGAHQLTLALRLCQTCPDYF
ncbi:uncharacterized [Tachysurus ichikawai]